MMKFLLDQWKGLIENFLFRSIVFVFLSILLFLTFYILKVPEVFYSIPLALISVAAFSIYEAKEFRNMLRNTMYEIVQDVNYLKILKREKLDDILNKFHQVYYGLPETVDANNLYNFIKKNILDKYIGEAYVDWSIETANGNLENWKREDIGSCVIQENYSCKHYLEYNVTKDMPIRVKSTIVAYESTDDRTAHQIFALPTHALKLTIIVHNFQDTKFNLKFAGIPPSKPDRDEKVSPTQYKIEFGGWMIPGNSVTVTF